MLIDTIRELCLSRRENILIEGTLSWPGHGLRITGELAAAEYTKVQIVEVEAPAAVAHEQALHPAGSDRFLLQRRQGLKVCSECARCFPQRRRPIPDVSLTMYSGTGDGQYDETLRMPAPQ